jgi:3-hydroxybutyryl-CoA dehydrogenase
MISEAFFVLGEGDTSATEIDEGMMLGCNHLIGPLALADLIGLDVLLVVMQTIHDEFGDSKYRPCPLLREMVAAGYLGRKIGRGVCVTERWPFISRSKRSRRRRAFLPDTRSPLP